MHGWQSSVASDAPASTPPLNEMWAAWNTIIQADNLWLDALTTDKLQQHIVRDGKPTLISWDTLTCQSSSATLMVKRPTGQSDSKQQGVP